MLDNDLHLLATIMRGDWGIADIDLGFIVAAAVAWIGALRLPVARRETAPIRSVAENQA